MALEYLTLALLLAAACHDVVSRTIPDMISILLAVVAGLGRLLEGPVVLAISAAAALLLLALLLIAHSYAVIGGGDVKLMAALAIGLSPLDSCRFVIATAIAGGLLAVVYLLLARVTRPASGARRGSRLRRVLAIEAWRIRTCESLPYGVAIAGGGAFVLFHPGSF